MSRTALVELTFADGLGDGVDGKYRFRLAIKQLRELQELCGDVGPAVIAYRLQAGQWKVDDVVQPIRLGLIGAGMAADKALSLVKRYVETDPADEMLIAHTHTAHAIVLASYIGVESEPVGEQRAAEGTTIQNDGSPSPRSSEPQPSSAGTQEN